tara:strand:- start:118 stop:498 length:381 start_codon:yes stop_codon:yes gene_type:complete
MARRTRRKSRKSKSSRRRRRQSGGAGVAQNAGDFGAAEPVAQAGGDVEEGMGHKGGDQKGGRRKRKTKGRKAKSKTKKKKGKKRGLNPYFKLMLAAKKKGDASFKYKGKTYKGKKHPRLGMIYKKA